MKQKLLIVIVSVCILFTGCLSASVCEASELDRAVKYNGEYTVKQLEFSRSDIKKPYGICTFNEYIVVCDYDGNRLALLDKEGKYQKSIGELGSGKVEFSNPTGITVHDNNLYVLDSGNSRVQVLNENFEYVDQIKLNVLVHKQGGFCYTDIAVDSDGTVYVTTDSVGIHDAYISVLKDGKILTTKPFVGYLAEYDGKVYAANTLELTHTKNKDYGESGKNALYQMDSNRMKKLYDLPNKLTPCDFIVAEENILFTSSNLSNFIVFSNNGEYLGVISDLSSSSLLKYVAKLDNGNYITTDAETKQIFVIQKAITE